MFCSYKIIKFTQSQHSRSDIKKLSKELLILKFQILKQIVCFSNSWTNHMNIVQIFVNDENMLNMRLFSSNFTLHIAGASGSRFNCEK